MSASTPSGEHQEPAEQLLTLQHKLTFLQKSFDELNEMVLLQHKEIELVKKESKQLREMLFHLRDSGWGDDLPHEKPPHY